MTYSLGIDLGATSCVVAMRRGAGVEVCRIGRNGAGMPAIALPQPHGSLLVGEEADARSAYEPALVARYVVSRLGDGEPIDIDGRDLDPLALTRAVLREAVERAAPRGTRPDQIVVTYPLSPGVGPEELIADAAAEEFGPTATLVPAPVAAVARFAAERSLDEDAVVAVVDVGGSSVDVTLVRRTPTAFDLVGEPATLADLGGVDLDSAVWRSAGCGPRVVPPRSACRSTTSRWSRWRCPTPEATSRSPATRSSAPSNPPSSRRPISCSPRSPQPA
jgi:molecular chaperone DnaK